MIEHIHRVLIEPSEEEEDSEKEKKDKKDKKSKSRSKDKSKDKKEKKKDDWKVMGVQWSTTAISSLIPNLYLKIDQFPDYSSQDQTWN